MSLPKLIAMAAAPLQYVGLVKALTVGSGFTVTEAVVVAELQPLALAVMVKTVVCAVSVALVKVPVMVDPLPLAAIPVRLVVLFLVQV